MECRRYEEVPQGNEKLLAYALFKHGPVAIGIDATLTTFHLYSKGPDFKASLVLEKS